MAAPFRTDIRTRPATKSNGKPKRRNRSDRFEVFNYVIDVHQGSMPDADFRVWVTLWRLADSKGMVARSHKALKELCGIHRDTVKRSVRRLIKRKLLVLVESGSPERNEPNRYRVSHGE